MNGTLTLDDGPPRPDDSPLGSAMQAARAGASDAADAARRFLPVAGRFLRDVGYNSGYAISYGLALPSFLIARAVPPENPIAHGFSDGARAAIDMARESKAESAAPRPEAQAQSQSQAP